MKPFFNDFRDKEHVFNEFELNDDQKRFVQTIVLASYTYENYSGDAFVLFRGSDSKYYEVNGSHCSCNGLEGDWSPEEISVVELENRIKNGKFLEYGEHGEGPREVMMDFIKDFEFNKNLEKLLENK